MEHSTTTTIITINDNISSITTVNPVIISFLNMDDIRQCYQTSHCFLDINNIYKQKGNQYIKDILHQSKTPQQDNKSRLLLLQHIIKGIIILPEHLHILIFCRLVKDIIDNLIIRDKYNHNNNHHLTSLGRSIQNMMINSEENHHHIINYIDDDSVNVNSIFHLMNDCMILQDNNNNNNKVLALEWLISISIYNEEIVNDHHFNEALEFLADKIPLEKVVFLAEILIIDKMTDDRCICGTMECFVKKASTMRSSSSSLSSSKKEKKEYYNHQLQWLAESAIDKMTDDICICGTIDCLKECLSKNALESLAERAIQKMDDKRYISITIEYIMDKISPEKAAAFLKMAEM